MKSKLYCRIPIFNDEYAVIFYFGDKPGLKKTAHAWHVKLSDKDYQSFDNCRGVTVLADDRHPIIAMHSKPNDAELIGTLAHEACHAVDKVFDSIGQSHRVYDEVYAHSVGAVVRHSLEFIGLKNLKK
jgi:hypothetical protein